MSDIVQAMEMSSKLLSQIVESPKSFALLEDSKSSPEQSNNLLFSNPQNEIIAHNNDELPAALEKIEQVKKQGLYVCGYLAYEAAYYFLDKNIPNTKNPEQPLLYFIAFKDLHRPSREQIDQVLKQDKASQPCIYDLKLNVPEKNYIKTIARIKKYIEAGDTYQINYTIKYNFKLQGNSTSLYKALRKTQPVEFGALLNFTQSKIVSLSPELFIHKKKDVLTSKPMKGTAKRGATKKEDQEIIRFLKADSKTLSENVMIVDLIRNDFGRICRTGSVKVKNLFQVQTFKSIHQMISTVKGTLKKGLSFTDILFSLFPCGSITGAPKIRTMEIINELETEARGIYTGAIGYLLPNDDFYFNVPIRTIVVGDGSDEKKCEMGIGSGIIHESDAHDEFAECLLKANFLRSINNNFYLIETFRFETNDIKNLEKHLERLTKSAEYFGFEVDLKSVKTKIDQLENNLLAKKKNNVYKIRLTVDQRGEFNLSHDVIQKDTIGDSIPKKVILSDVKIDSTSIFQYHKTSCRKHYNDAFDTAEKEGYYDVLFFNEKDQLAEASRHNVFIIINGDYFTPPLSAGILNGVEREEFIKIQKVTEKHLSKQDLLDADEILLTNSVRGVVSVELE